MKEMSNFTAVALAVLEYCYWLLHMTTRLNQLRHRVYQLHTVKYTRYSFLLEAESTPGP